jgi:hypothetical protein
MAINVQAVTHDVITPTTIKCNEDITKKKGGEL